MVVVIRGGEEDEFYWFEALGFVLLALDEIIGVDKQTFVFG